LQQVTFILLISLIGGSLIFIWFMARVAQPIRQLAVATDEISQNRWDTPLPEYKGKDEIAQLTAAFGRMSARLSETHKDLNEHLEKVEKSQKALRRSEQKYRELVEMLPEVVFETDNQAKLLFVNDIAYQFFGYDQTILSKGMSIYNMIVPEDRPRAMQNMKRLFDGQSIGMLEFSGLRKDGSTFPVLALASPIMQEGRPVGLRGIFVDITERKALEDKLKNTQRFLQDILNNMADPVFVKDEAHRWILVNNAYCTITGLKREDLLGKSDYDYFAKEEADVFWEKDNLVFSSQETNENEEIFTDPEGKRHIFLTKKTVFTEGQGNKILVGIIKNITERKQLEQEIFKSQKLESAGIFAGGIAHDFNNILMTVIGNLSLAATMVSPADAIYETLLETEKAALRARDLTQQLLTFSRGGAPVKGKKKSEQQPQPGQLMTGNGRILVMDDEEIICKVVGAMLRHLGYDSEFAANGADALKKYETRLSDGQPFDAVIMDLTIPGGMGGKEAIGKLLAIDPNAVAIVSSGYSSDPIMADYATYGFTGVIAKPFEMKNLGNILHSLQNKQA
jgi:PAS domain S-box-containing protein